MTNKDIGQFQKQIMGTLAEEIMTHLIMVHIARGIAGRREYERY